MVRNLKEIVNMSIAGINTFHVTVNNLPSSVISIQVIIYFIKLECNADIRLSNVRFHQAVLDVIIAQWCVSHVTSKEAVLVKHTGLSINTG